LPDALAFFVYLAAALSFAVAVLAGETTRFRGRSIDRLSWTALGLLLALLPTLYAAAVSAF
jgi:hypothetical protein